MLIVFTVNGKYRRCLTWIVKKNKAWINCMDKLLDSIYGKRRGW